MAPNARPPGAVPLVLVVDDNAKVREVVRVVLELEGAAVAEAGSLQDARRLLGRRVEAVVLDRQLPDGDGLDLLPDVEHFCPGARVVVFSDVDDGRQPPELPRVDKGDLPALMEALVLAPPAPSPRRLAVSDLVAQEPEALVGSWRELCRWDPELALADVPMAAAVVRAVGDALGRPQPLAWGVDPGVETAVEAYAAGLEPALAVGQLACLGEALRRLVGTRVPPDEVFETMSRLQMVLERAMGVVVRAPTSAAGTSRPPAANGHASEGGRTAALGDRQALLRALGQELARASRHGRGSTLLAVRAGAGSAGSARLAEVLSTAMRRSDSAYSGDDGAIVVILPESGIGGARAILGRASGLAGSELTWAACHLPGDGDDPHRVLELAATRLRDEPRAAPADDRRPPSPTAPSGSVGAHAREASA